VDDDYYHYSGTSHALIGETSKTSYRLGDGVDIKVINVNMEEHAADCILVRIGGNEVGKAKGKALGQNKKASCDYFIEDTYEAGIVLKGTEINSIRAGRVNLNDAHVRIMNGEAQLINMHIAPYEQGNRFNHDPTRSRKLLLH